MFIKKGIRISLLPLLVLTACQPATEELVFVGAGEYWSSNVTVLQADGEETYKIELDYKQANLQAMKSFSYAIQTKNNTNLDFKERDASFNKHEHYQKHLPISNSRATSAEDELVLIIEWNGVSEKFTLTNE